MNIFEIKNLVKYPGDLIINLLFDRISNDYVNYIFYSYSLLFNTPHLPKVKKVDLLQSSIIDASLLLNTLNIVNPEFCEPKLNSNHYELPNINVDNFGQLEVKLCIKLHKTQINDCLFIDQTLANSNTNKENINNKFKLPLICSVSSDNWMKIYSIDDRSLFR
jgi:hypothetical protein